MRTTILFSVAGLLASSSLVCGQALNSFGPGNAYDPAMSRPVRGLNSPSGAAVATGHLFTAQNSGTIRQITTVLQHNSGDNNYTIQVRTGDPNGVGGIVGSWPVQGGTAANPIITFDTGNFASVNMGQTYWLCAIGHGSATGQWYLNVLNMSGEWSTSSNEGLTWFLVNGSRLPAALLAFEVAPVCYPNCDGSTIEPVLNVADFSCFLSKFAAGDPYANCDGSTIEPVLNVADFSCFLSKFAAGCR
jgi:hypothetical protein